MSANQKNLLSYQFFFKKPSKQRKILLLTCFMLFTVFPCFANEGGKIIRGGIEALLFFGGLFVFLIFLLVTLTFNYPKYQLFTAINILLFIVIFNTPKLYELVPGYFLMGQIWVQVIACIGITIVKLADKRAERLNKRS